jgi:hypothetical protein
MDQLLDQTLCDHYPHLYQGRRGDPKTTLMCWGFACSNGWYPLLDSVSHLITERCPEVVAQQVKEKFGSLRFYYVGGDDYCDGVARMAGTLSGELCEICGNPGQLGRIGGWFQCRCDEHAQEKYANDFEPAEPVMPVYGLPLGWSRLVHRLEAALQWDVDKNGMPSVKLSVPPLNGALQIKVLGGDEVSRGMADLVMHYAQRLEPHTGRLLETLPVAS